MSTVDKLVNIVLDTKVPFIVARNQVTRNPLSYEDSKEFDERVFKCENCGEWHSTIEQNMIVDIVLCDSCFNH